MVDLKYTVRAYVTTSHVLVKGKLQFEIIEVFTHRLTFRQLCVRSYKGCYTLREESRRFWRFYFHRAVLHCGSPPEVMMADTLSFTAKVDLVDFWVKMRSGIVHHKSDRKLCVIPTADRNTPHMVWVHQMGTQRRKWLNKMTKCNGKIIESPAPSFDTVYSTFVIYLVRRRSFLVSHD